jgi:hypothetical protein
MISNFPGSSRTVRSSEGLNNHVAAQKPFLRQEHKERRVGFALEYLVKDQEFWNKVILSDEKTFQSCMDGGVKVYMLPLGEGKPLYPFLSKLRARRSVRFSIVKVYMEKECRKITFIQVSPKKKTSP